MKVVRKKPNDSIRYNKWFDNSGTYDIWYREVIHIYNYQEMDIPSELKTFLNKWSKKIVELKETYCELYPVKLAHIEFIYEDVVYSIYPETINATYMTDFLRNEMYEVSWDSLFEYYEREIRNDLKKELGVIHSRYYGFLD